MKDENIAKWLKKEDLEKVSKELGISLQSVRSAVSGRSKNGKATPLIIAIAEVRREEYRKQAERLVRRKDKKEIKQ